MQCIDGCGEAEYRLINGEIEELLCRASFDERLHDLVTCNLCVQFTEIADGKPDGLTTYTLG